MAGIPDPFRNLSFGDFVGIRVAIVVEGEGRIWAICIVLGMFDRKWFCFPALF